LSGRNFETKTFEEDISRESFERLKKGVINFSNETNFKRFIMIIRSAGFIDPSMITSQNALNFAYILYLKLRSIGYNPARIESLVRKWFVFSILTGRYSGSPESTIDFDIKNIASENMDQYVTNTLDAELSDAFWDLVLIQRLNTSSVNSPFFNTYLAAHCKSNTKGLFSKDITIADMVNLKGDVHHIFPRDYMKKAGYSRSMYNQIANFAYVQTEINIAIGNKSPEIYFNELKKQCESSTPKYGGIISITDLNDNLRDNDIPDKIFSHNLSEYDDFLQARRRLMASRLKKYYNSL
jgi:hypothetical protein